MNRRNIDLGTSFVRYKLYHAPHSSVTWYIPARHGVSRDRAPGDLARECPLDHQTVHSVALWRTCNKVHFQDFRVQQSLVVWRHLKTSHFMWLSNTTMLVCMQARAFTRVHMWTMCSHHQLLLCHVLLSNAPSLGYLSSKVRPLLLGLWIYGVRLTVKT